MRTVRTADAAAVYAHPGTQMVRLERLGLLHKVAVGYYVVVPQERIGTDWRPTIEATAAGVATAALGPARAPWLAAQGGRRLLRCRASGAHRHRLEADYRSDGCRGRDGGARSGSSALACCTRWPSVTTLSCLRSASAPTGGRLSKRRLQGSRRRRSDRLERLGLLHKVAVGYYVVVPQERIGTDWRPTIEATAAGVATAALGAGRAVLMGVSAARVHNVLPRALGIAIVAVPGDRRDIVLRDRDGLVHFVERDTDVLDAELMTTDLGQCLVTRAA